jgi:hypothetical protein
MKQLTLHVPHGIRSNAGAGGNANLPGPEEPILKSIHVCVGYLSHTSFTFVGPSAVVIPAITAS